MSTRGRALLDDAVGGDLLARADDEAVADRELLDGHAALGAVGVEDRDVLGAELEQRLQRRAGAALGARLEVAAGEEERRHDRRPSRGRSGRRRRRASGMSVEGHPHVVHAGVAEEQRVQRPEPGRRASPSADQRVHRRRAVPEVRPGGAVERPGAPQDDRASRAAATATASCRTAAPGSSTSAARGPRGRPRRRAGGAAAAVASGSASGAPPAASRRGQRRPVAGGLDGRDELLGGDGGRGRSSTRPSRSRS